MLLAKAVISRCFSSSTPSALTTPSMIASGRAAQPGHIDIHRDDAVHAAGDVVALAEDAAAGRRRCPTATTTFGSGSWW